MAVPLGTGGYLPYRHCLAQRSLQYRERAPNPGSRREPPERRNGNTMTIAIVSIITLIATFVAPAALSLRYGVDSRVDDGRYNW